MRHLDGAPEGLEMSRWTGDRPSVCEFEDYDAPTTDALVHRRPKSPAGAVVEEHGPEQVYVSSVREKCETATSRYAFSSGAS